ncbi:MAG: hypothetical protein AAFN06_18930, partial [Pseudomonadota bacterium]
MTLSSIRSVAFSSSLVLLAGCVSTIEAPGSVAVDEPAAMIKTTEANSTRVGASQPLNPMPSDTIRITFFAP